MADTSNILSRLFEPFFGWDIAGTYQNAYQFIDFALYLIFFISVTKYALAKQIDNKKMRNSLAIILGISFAIALSLFSQRWGFMIGDLAPMAGIIFLALLGMIFFKFLRDLGEKTPGAGAFAFLLLFFSITAIVPGFYNWLIDKVDFLEPLLSLAVFFAVFIAVRDMIQLISGEKKEEEEEWPGIKDKKEREEKTPEKEEKREKLEEELAKAKAKQHGIIDQLKQKIEAGKQAGEDTSQDESMLDQINQLNEKQKKLSHEEIKDLNSLRRDFVDIKKLIKKYKTKEDEETDDNQKKAIKEEFFESLYLMINKIIPKINILSKLENDEILNNESIKKLHNIENEDVPDEILNLSDQERRLFTQFSNLWMSIDKGIKNKTAAYQDIESVADKLKDIVIRIIRINKDQLKRT